MYVALGIALASCVLTSVEGLNASYSGDDTLTLYVDGVQLITATEYGVTYHSQIDDNFGTIAIQSSDNFGLWGIWLLTPTILKTDGTWKCTHLYEVGWLTPAACMDDTWTEAKLVFNDGDTLVPPAEWIWNGVIHYVTYCRWHRKWMNCPLVTGKFSLKEDVAVISGYYEVTLRSLTLCLALCKRHHPLCVTVSYTVTSTGYYHCHLVDPNGMIGQPTAGTASLMYKDW